MRRATHLTNDAVQKTMAGYGAFEEANKLSMAQLQAALSGQVGRHVDMHCSSGRMQRCRDAEMQRCRDAEMRVARHWSMRFAQEDAESTGVPRHLRHACMPKLYTSMTPYAW